jgi:hypothetical protein
MPQGQLGAITGDQAEATKFDGREHLRLVVDEQFDKEMWFSQRGVGPRLIEIAVDHCS